MKEEWNNSISKSNIIDDWMDDYVYSSSAFTDFVRYDYSDNVILQNRGCDVVFKLAGRTYVCDEKCAAEKANVPLRTFAFSLSQNNKNSEGRHEEWFVKDNMANDSYLLQYINVAKNEDGTLQDKDTLTKEGIKEMELILVTKKKLYAFLESNGMSKDRLLAGNDWMLESGLKFFPEEGANKWKYGWRLHRDFEHTEQTVNVLIKKSDLIGISDWHQTITL